jgi:hypothetical protein
MKLSNVEKSRMKNYKLKPWQQHIVHYAKRWMAAYESLKKWREEQQDKEKST